MNSKVKHGSIIGQIHPYLRFLKYPIKFETLDIIHPIAITISTIRQPVETSTIATKAYNAALLLLKDNVDIIIWADDDTFFPETYFEALRSYACKNLNATVFLPVVKSNEVIVSPCIYTKRAMKTIQSLEELQGQKISGINSGMAVRSSLYQQFKYDEAYFLDYVDHDFMRWCRLNEQEFCVMGQVVLQQTFFAHSNAAKKAKRKRFKIYKKDYSRFQRKCGVPFSQIVNDLLRKFIYEQFISH